jgi:hypothetical protein
MQVVTVPAVIMQVVTDPAVIMQVFTDPAVIMQVVTARGGDARWMGRQGAAVHHEVSCRAPAQDREMWLVCGFGPR